MVGLLLSMMLAGAGFAPGTGFAPIRVYEGTWTVVASHTMAGEGRPDTIVNHCHEGTAFYTCEQVVNGKSLALIVYTVTDDPTKFHTQPVLPGGQAVGRGDLTIAGDHWTFSGSGKDDAGKETFFARRTSLRGGTRSILSSMSPVITRRG